MPARIRRCYGIVKNEGPSRFQSPSDVQLLFADAFDTAEALQVHRQDIDQYRDGRPNEYRKWADLTVGICSDLVYGAARVSRCARQRQRYANVIVQASDRSVRRCCDDFQSGGEQAACRRLATGTSDREHRNLATEAVPCGAGKGPERVERVVDNDLRDIRGHGLRDKGCRGACSRRGGHEVVTVAPASTGTVVARIVTGERYEQVAASEAAGVDGNPGYRGGVGSPEAEYLFDLASVVQGRGVFCSGAHGRWSRDGC